MFNPCSKSSLNFAGILTLAYITLSKNSFYFIISVNLILNYYNGYYYCYPVSQTKLTLNYGYE